MIQWMVDSLWFWMFLGLEAVATGISTFCVWVLEQILTIFVGFYIGVVSPLLAAIGIPPVDVIGFFTSPVTQAVYSFAKVLDKFLPVAEAIIILVFLNVARLQAYFIMTLIAIYKLLPFKFS